MASTFQRVEKRFSLINLGCKVNRVESDEASALLLSEGWVATSVDDAHVIIVNTCTVTGEAEKKTRKAVHRALSGNAEASVIVTGCAAAIAPEVFAEMSGRVRVVPKAELMDCLQRICCASYSQSTRVVDAGLLRTGSGFNTRIGVKIQDGCAHACSYCIVHVARGKPWSKPLAFVREEVRGYARAGAKEVVLTGINLGSYRDGQVDFALLLEMLCSDIRAVNATCEPGQGMRLRLSSIEPLDVSEGVIALLSQTDGMICRHLHLPVQSGSTKVLNEMHRPYSADEYLALVERLRAEIPQISLSTDIIAGFPGETEDDFDQSIVLCRRAGFSKMHVFPYSPREGTSAAARSDQVAADVKAFRARALRTLGAELRELDRASRAGTIERALVESDGIAMTESYHEVEPACSVPQNSFFNYCF